VKAPRSIVEELGEGLELGQLGHVQQSRIERAKVKACSGICQVVALSIASTGSMGSMASAGSVVSAGSTGQQVRWWPRL
jgi:hypothetical protein